MEFCAVYSFPDVGLTKLLSDSGLSYMDANGPKTLSRCEVLLFKAHLKVQTHVHVEFD